MRQIHAEENARKERTMPKIKDTTQRPSRPWGSNPNLPDCNTINRRIKAQG